MACPVGIQSSIAPVYQRRIVCEPYISKVVKNPCTSLLAAPLDFRLEVLAPCFIPYHDMGWDACYLFIVIEQVLETQFHLLVFLFISPLSTQLAFVHGSREDIDQFTSLSNCYHPVPLYDFIDT